LQQVEATIAIGGRRAVSKVQKEIYRPGMRNIARFEGGEVKAMMRHRFGFAMTAAALIALGVSGCATKNYVHTQTGPLIDHTDQLDQRSADNNRAIHDVDDRAQAGITKAQGSADAADANAQNASQEANTADTTANDVSHRADTLDSVVKGLDNYREVTKVSVTFGFDKAMLTNDDRAELDSFAGQLGSAKSYILEVTGGTDSAGSAQYNYQLSQRRADAVVQYLAAKYGIAPHRFYLIGIGKDQFVASNNTPTGRKENRRVQVRLLSNMASNSATSETPAAVTGQAKPSGESPTTVQE
jgi:outer membrane protein OmpA-like peptidoglycan-associated protein